MPAACRRAPRDFAAGRARRRDHWVGFFRLTERVPATRPPRPRCGTLPPASMPVVCRRRDHKGDFHRLTERVPARASRDLAADRARRRDHKGDFHRPTERVPARAPATSPRAVPAAATTRVISIA